MGLLSTATVATIGLTCKTFLNIPGLCSITVNGLSNLVEVLESKDRERGRGIVTVANHISTLDDPVTWGVLPARFYFSSRTTRWSLGASDIMFTNPLFSQFFRLGQVLETFRGQGIYQPALDVAIDKLNQGEWVHLFGEGKVNQPDTYPILNKKAHLTRFKWGVGRVIMETDQPPVILPMWLTGFDELMPEGRAFPCKYIPRVGVHLSVTVGEPLREDGIRRSLSLVDNDYSRTGSMPSYKIRGNLPETERTIGWIGEGVPPSQVAQVRSRVTAIVQNAVEALGRRVSGDLLGSRRTHC